MRAFVILLSVLFLNNSISFANLQEVLEKATKEYISTRFLNATFLFAQRDKNLVVGAKGVFSLYGEQLKANQEMFIGAATKPIIAAAILRLQDKGLLNVKDKIVKHIDPEYWYEGRVPKFAGEVTIHHLLTHTAGLPDYTRHVKTDLSMSQKEINKNIIKFISSKMPYSGSKINKYNYSNSNFILLGIIIETVSKKDLRSFLQDEFFKPLKMTSTKLATFKESKEMQKNSSISNYPLRYYVQPNNGKPKFMLINSQFSFAPKYSYIPSADGGIISNTFDLIKWYRALHQGKILSENSYKLMTAKHYLVQSKVAKSSDFEILDDPKKKKNFLIHLNRKLYKTYMGYGIYIAELDNKDLMFHHPGGSTGFGIRSETGYIPSKDFYFAILSNVVVQIPSTMENSLNMNNTVNQLDISYFREVIINSIMEE